MRTSYHEELDSIIDRLVHMAELAEAAIKTASEALLTADLTKAETVITNDAELDRLHEEMEYKCLSLLALQAPVAGELRILINGRDELHVVDVLRFDADGRIDQIHAYVGRGD